MDTILEVKDLCKTYIINKRQNNVLRNVSFHISRTEDVYSSMDLTAYTTRMTSS